VLGFSRHWINEDQTLLWHAARDLGAGRILQPSFYGQAYLTTFEALPAEVLRWFGVPLWTGVPIATAALVVGPWLAVAAAAWHRRRSGAAAAALALPVVMRTEFLVSVESPGGRGAGIAAAMVGTALVVAWPDRVRSVAAGLGLLALGVVWNPTSLVLAAAVGAWVLVEHRSRRVVLEAAVASLPAAAWFAWAQLFVRARPDHDIHRGASFAPDLTVLRATLGDIGRYVDVAAPELARSWLVVAAATAAVFALAIASRRAAPVAAVAGVVGGLAVMLAAPKALDGTGSPWLSFGRYVHLLPVALWFVVTVTVEPRRRSLGLAAVGAAVVVSAATFTVRAVTFDERTSAIAAIGRATAGAPVTPVAETLARCDTIDDLDVPVVVFRYDRTGAYACGALAYDRQRTLFPAYDRRTWLLHDESTRRRTAFAFTEADGEVCARLPAEASAIVMCDAGGRIGIVRGENLDVLSTWRAAGEDVREFEQPERP